MGFLASREYRAEGEPCTVFLYRGNCVLTHRECIILGNVKVTEDRTTYVYIPATDKFSLLTIHMQYAGYGFNVQGQGDIAIFQNGIWSICRVIKYLCDNKWHMFSIRENIVPYVYQVYACYRVVREKTHQGVWIIRLDDRSFY